MQINQLIKQTFLLLIAWINDRILKNKRRTKNDLIWFTYIIITLHYEIALLISEHLKI